jgi:hypothetical protein
MVLPGARPTSVGWLLLATKASFDGGTIETSRVKARCKFPFLAHQLSVFFAPVRYRVVKITHSCSEVVLCTTKLKEWRRRPEGGEWEPIKITHSNLAYIPNFKIRHVLNLEKNGQVLSLGQNGQVLNLRKTG